MGKNNPTIANGSRFDIEKVLAGDHVDKYRVWLVDPAGHKKLRAKFRFLRDAELFAWAATDRYLSRYAQEGCDV